MRIGAPGPWTAAELGRGVLAGLPHYGLALWVLAAVVGALVPMPALLVDLLLTLSLAGSTALLVASLAARRSADFLGFPTLLILVTLSRLSLNVTTTRMILTEGDAGRVIDAFATLVIREDLIVGAVMFASTRSGPAARAKSTTSLLNVVPLRACSRPFRIDGLKVLPGRVAPTSSAFTHELLMVCAL